MIDKLNGSLIETTELIVKNPGEYKQFKQMRNCKIGDYIYDNHDELKQILDIKLRKFDQSKDKMVEICVKPITGSPKAVNYFKNYIRCLDTHILMLNNSKIFAKDLKVGSHLSGYFNDRHETISVESIEYINSTENLIDIQVEGGGSFQIFPFRLVTSKISMFLHTYKYYQKYYKNESFISRMKKIHHDIMFILGEKYNYNYTIDSFHSDYLS